MVRQIQRKIRAVQWWLHWIAFCRRFLRVLATGCALLALYVLVSRLVPLRVTPLQVAPWIAGGAVVWILARSWVRRIRIMDAAVRADEALGLKERLSTALSIRQVNSEAEAAVLEDAAEHARAIRPTRAFPMRLGRPFSRALVSAAALAALWLYMPQYDLLAKAKTKAQPPGQAPLEVAARTEAAKKLEDLAKDLAKTERTEKSVEAQKIEKEMNALARQINEQKMTGEQAAAKMEKIAEKIAARREEIQKSLEKASTMQTKGEGRNTSEISKAMQKGDFAKAAKAMENLKKQLQNGQMNQEQKNALSKELKQMSEQLGKDSPLSQALQQAAQQMDQGQMNSAMASLEQAQGQMGDMQAMLQEMKALEGMSTDMEGRMAALTGQLGVLGKEGMGMGNQPGNGASDEQGHGKWTDQDNRDQGNGMGGGGIGRGSVAESKAGPTKTQKKMLPGDMQPGQIIARMKFDGTQKPGDIKTKFEDLRVQASQAAEDTIKSEQLPMEKRALVRQYFDAIKDGQSAATPATAPPAATQKP